MVVKLALIRLDSLQQGPAEDAAGSSQRPGNMALGNLSPQRSLSIAVLL